MKRNVLIALLCLCSGAAMAADSQGGLKFVVGGGFTYGGDKLATAQYTNGSSADVRAGSLLDIHAGLEYRFDQFAVQSTVGYHFDSADATNGSITFSRVPVELLGYYQVSQSIRLGGGLRKSTGAQLDGDGVASNIGTVKFDADPGFVLEGEYLVGKNLGFKLRYVAEKFKAKTGNAKDIDGNHVGIFMNAYF